MRAPLQPIATQQQEQTQQAAAATANTKTLSITATIPKNSSLPTAVFEPVDDAPVVFAQSLALAKKVAETGDASVDFGDENKRSSSGGSEGGGEGIDAHGGVAALLSRVLRASGDLEGRCVGRNRDDARAIRSGLVELASAVGALERRAAEAGGAAEVKKREEGGCISLLFFHFAPLRKTSSHLLSLFPSLSLDRKKKKT